jgi:hypothetical protein
MAELQYPVEYEKTTATRRRDLQVNNGKSRFATIWANKKVVFIAAAAS